MANVDRRYVTVPVTALWTSPTAPRDVDAWAVAPLPDVTEWLADLDAAGARRDLRGRVHTQLECGEPILINDAHLPATGACDPGWLKVLAPLQPSAKDPRGYPGWVRAEHIGEDSPHCSLPTCTAEGQQAAPDTQAFIQTARRRLGVPYLWGGMCAQAVDCSGLVHLSLRRLGVTFPRDAADQYDMCEHLPVDRARPGDLFFFAHLGRRPHHVGIVTGSGRMLHAPETGSVVMEEQLTASRRITLIGAGRLPTLANSAGNTA